MGGIFDFGTDAFRTLVVEFRQRVVEETAREGVGLILTMAWSLDDDEDAAMVADYDEAAIPVGTALGISWTYNDVALCQHSRVLTEEIVQGDSFRKCLTSIRGSGTYAVTITRGSDTVGFYSQFIDVD